MNLMGNRTKLHTWSTTAKEKGKGSKIKISVVNAYRIIKIKTKLEGERYKAF